jgi:hypothetical protein
MKRIVATVLFLLLGISGRSAHGEEEQTAKRIDASLQTPPKLIIRAEDLFPLTGPSRLGMLTLVSPDANGEVIRLSIPVGELVSRAARAFSDANHRRAERRADERVRKDLGQFNAAAANGMDTTPNSRHAKESG